MPFDDLLGKTTKLAIKRFGPPGAFLDVSAFEEGAATRDATVLLIGSEIPEGAAVGDEVCVVLYLDSEARPIATTRKAKLERGQVTFLEVTATTSFGAFVDWGLAKELLVPFAEQTTAMEVGARHPVGILLDATHRLIGTMRVAEILKQHRADVVAGAWLEGEAWRNEPDTGLFVILEKSFLGMVPASEPHTLGRGDRARFRVSRVLADGKIELSLRAPAHEESKSDAAKLLAFLGRSDAPPVGDKSDPEELRSLFGFSKKAFKRAAGNLLKQGVAEIDAAGQLTLKKPTA
jgi:uncharacterized protein